MLGKGLAEYFRLMPKAPPAIRSLENRDGELAGRSRLPTPTGWNPIPIIGRPHRT